MWDLYALVYWWFIWCLGKRFWNVTNSSWAPRSCAAPGSPAGLVPAFASVRARWGESGHQSSVLTRPQRRALSRCLLWLQIWLRGLMKAKQGEGDDGLTCRPVTVSRRLRSSETSKISASAIMGCSAIPAGRPQKKLLTTGWRMVTSVSCIFFFLSRRYPQRLTFPSESFSCNDQSFDFGPFKRWPD